jgi:DNA invertase Pin-like site-specific DNA recombinase
VDSIQHAIAADDRRRIVARMRAGAQVKAAQYPQSRAFGGKVPYGYRRAKASEANRTGLALEPEQAKQVRRIFDLIRDGQSIGQVAKELGWHRTQVARIAKREQYKREPRVVDPRVWNQAQRVLAGRRKR